MKEKKEKKQNVYFRHMAEAIKMELREHKSSFMVYLILRILVIVMLVLQVLNQNYENVFLCILTLLLLIVPSFVQVTFKIELPTTLEIIVLFFIFAAEILGEINEFYLLFPFWDTVLHTLNGFLAAAIGFSLVDLLNRSERTVFNLSPVFTAIVAFCFSMTVGVVWEFFEFGMDQIFGMDMQKDFIVNAIHSATLNPNGLNGTVSLNGITSTIVNYNGGQYVIEGGYLDVGIIDTMKDLMVNCIGAVVFSIIGILYIKHRGKGKIAKSFIPLMKTTEEIEETQKMIEEFKSKKRRNKNEKVKLNVGVNNDGDNGIGSDSTGE